MKRITIKDLAKLLNLSASTVSRALSDHPDISPSTKFRVKELAREMNYTANVHARFFREQHSGLIALILPEVNTFFTPNLIRGINKTISSTDYSLITFLTDDSYRREKKVIKQCLNWAVEGVLLSLSSKTKDLSHLTPLIRSKTKCVLFDKSLRNLEYPSVLIDSVDASYRAISHLIRNGHKNILGIFGHPDLSITQERLKGYEKALKEYSIPILQERIIFLEKKNNLDFVLPPILKHDKKITACFTMSDELLAFSLYHFNKLKISIPNDISIISISDGIYPYLVHPQITHIKDSGSKMGKQATKVLLNCIEGNQESSNLVIRVKTKLVELESVKSIKALPSSIAL